MQNYDNKQDIFQIIAKGLATVISDATTLSANLESVVSNNASANLNSLHLCNQEEENRLLLYALDASTNGCKSIAIVTLGTDGRSYHSTISFLRLKCHLFIC